MEDPTSHGSGLCAELKRVLDAAISRSHGGPGFSSVPIKGPWASVLSFIRIYTWRGGKFFVMDDLASLFSTLHPGESVAFFRDQAIFSGLDPLCLGKLDPSNAVESGVQLVSSKNLTVRKLEEVCENMQNSGIERAGFPPSTASEGAPCFEMPELRGEYCRNGEDGSNNGAESDDVGFELDHCMPEAWRSEMVCESIRRTSSEPGKTDVDTCCDGRSDTPFGPCGYKKRVQAPAKSIENCEIADRPFVCMLQNCHRAFKRLEHLKRHHRIHTGERPFRCTYPGCYKSFARSDNLSQHLKVHNANSVYRIDQSKDALDFMRRI